MTTITAATKTEELPVITEGQAKEFDFILVLDKSGSMGDASKILKGRSKWEEAQEFTEQFARFADKVDDDGLTVITFSSHAKVVDGVHADKVHEIFTTQQPGGSTNLTEALNEAFKKKFSSSKAAIILVMTDGVPDDEDGVHKAIVAAAAKCEKDSDIGILFVQVGDDAHAAKFLDGLDNHLDEAKFDIVAAMSADQAGGLTVEQLLWQAINA